MLFSPCQCVHTANLMLIVFLTGCDLNDLSAPLPHQVQIRRMMKRQVIECGIQVVLLCARVFAKIRRGAGHKQGCCQICFRCLGYLPAGCTLPRVAAFASHAIPVHTPCFQKLIQRMVSTRGILRSVLPSHLCVANCSHFY